MGLVSGHGAVQAVVVFVFILNRNQEDCDILQILRQTVHRLGNLQLACCIGIGYFKRVRIVVFDCCGQYTVCIRYHSNDHIMLYRSSCGILIIIHAGSGTLGFGDCVIVGTCGRIADLTKHTLIVGFDLNFFCVHSRHGYSTIRGVSADSCKDKLEFFFAIVGGSLRITSNFLGHLRLCNSLGVD